MIRARAANHGPKIPLLFNSGPFVDWYLIWLIIARSFRILLPQSRKIQSKTKALRKGNG